MRGLLIGGAVIGAVVLVALGTGLIDIGIDGGEAPEVEVSGGESPDVAVTTGEVEVGSEEVTVDVPTMNVEEAPDAEPEAEAEAREEAAEEQAEQQAN